MADAPRRGLPPWALGLTSAAVLISVASAAAAVAVDPDPRPPEWHAFDHDGLVDPPAPVTSVLSEDEIYDEVVVLGVRLGLDLSEAYCLADGVFREFDVEEVLASGFLEGPVGPPPPPGTPEPTLPVDEDEATQAFVGILNDCVDLGALEDVPGFPSGTAGG